MPRAKKEDITLTAVPFKTVAIELVGDSDLILCTKSRSYELAEVFKQSHPKGTELPKELLQPYNMWEKLITSIHWANPITFHDDDWSKYTEDEWTEYMTTNQPCILGKAFKDSAKEAFTSLGFKESTGKKGTDFTRGIEVSVLNPITFASVSYDQHLAKSNAMGSPNVLTQQNVFHGWKCEISLKYMEEAVPLVTILKVLNATGTFIGVGSRRGEGYGRYHVEAITG